MRLQRCSKVLPQFVAWKAAHHEQVAQLEAAHRHVPSVCPGCHGEAWIPVAGPTRPAVCGTPGCLGGHVCSRCRGFGTRASLVFWSVWDAFVAWTDNGAKEVELRVCGAAPEETLTLEFQGLLFASLANPECGAVEQLKDYVRGLEVSLTQLRRENEEFVDELEKIRATANALIARPARPFGHTTT